MTEWTKRNEMDDIELLKEAMKFVHPQHERVIMRVVERETPLRIKEHRCPMCNDVVCEGYRYCKRCGQRVVG